MVQGQYMFGLLKSNENCGEIAVVLWSPRTSVGDCHDAAGVKRDARQLLDVVLQ